MNTDDRDAESRADEDAYHREAHARLGTFVKRAEQALMAAKCAVLRPFDLTVPQYAALMAIRYLPGRSATQLARIAGVTQQTMAATLDILDSRGVIERRTSTVHAKVRTTHLTADGARLVEVADQHVRVIEQRLTDALSPAEAEQFRALSTRVAEALRVDTSGRTGGDE